MRKKILSTFVIFSSILSIQSCTSSQNSEPNFSSSSDSRVDISSGKYLKVQFLTGAEIYKFQQMPVVAVLNDIETYDKNGINKNNIIIKNCRIVLDSKLDNSTKRVSLTASKMTCVKDNKVKDVAISGYVTDDQFLFGINVPKEKLKNNRLNKSEDIYKISSGRTAFFFLTNNLSISF